ncbi:IS200/IS605 family element transposase accessory protein TnpB [Cyanobacterium aponinum FACHB-4101]|uniref:RNA-guided endonuclease InsQ/TnpB family protein n=1 Tax=Cyanobacterium aponinum TaxID=379064 RepID=UPI001681B9F5|nr:RNA-guided endonuclease TnpB family protein [Cyanobacterium aponinum]MBD2395080.1 IS200/IS605 family element transposase accessory protein TnpB [Cyanobacterium aponinum FACHB-4101]
MLKVVKVRLYPTYRQKESLAKAFGSCRWLWNRFLALTNETYKQTGKGLSRYDLQKQLPSLKKEYEWLTETYSQCLQVVCLNLSRSFINFFEKRASFPRFKSKHGKQSLSYPQNVKIKGDMIIFPKLGEIYAQIHRPIDGEIKTVTISKNNAEQYYASILFEDGKEQPKPNTEGKAIGLDMGIKDFCVTSDGSKFSNPRWLARHERNLRNKQKDLSRKQKGSNNRNKARIKVAKVHNKISRTREDFHHKLSRRIVNENQVVICENLNIKGMVRNHCLAKSIQQVGWGQFQTMLKYKCEQEGKVYLEIDRFFPSSKTCNHCLNVVKSLPLDIRRWKCPRCKTKHDRDVNASCNIRDEGLRIMSLGTSESAYRPDVRRGSRGRKKSTITPSVG